MIRFNIRRSVDHTSNSLKFETTFNDKDKNVFISKNKIEEVQRPFPKPMFHIATCGLHSKFMRKKHVFNQRLEIYPK